MYHRCVASRLEHECEQDGKARPARRAEGAIAISPDGAAARRAEGAMAISPDGAAARRAEGAMAISPDGAAAVSTASASMRSSIHFIAASVSVA